MLISCIYCNRLHKRGETCQAKPKDNRQKEPNNITRFRSTKLWQKKRLEIKERDKFLCQYCLKNGKYQFNKLEVHHITPISKNWYKRLKNSNLITLCCPCHKMADLEEISARELRALIKYEKTPNTSEASQIGLF
jgi:5-methylcytosine-specific restriction enzyme A